MVTLKRTLAAALVLMLVAAPAAAELKYTMRMEVKKGQTAGPPNQMMAMIGEQFTKMVPPGGADIIYTIGENGVRVEYPQAAMGQPAGTVLITRASGEMFALNPAQKTYYKLEMPDMSAMMAQAGMTPKVSTTRTGEFTEIKGVRAERVSFEWSVDLPIPPEARASLPPDFPASMEMTGDNWVSADKRYEKYGAMVASNKVLNMLAALGLDKIVTGGLVLKSIVRFGGTEMHGEVTAIGEEAAPAGFLEIPEGFKEVPPPQQAIR